MKILRSSSRNPSPPILTLCPIPLLTLRFPHRTRAAPVWHPHNTLPYVKSSRNRGCNHWNGSHRGAASSSPSQARRPQNPSDRRSMVRRKPLPPDRGTIRDVSGKEIPKPWTLAVLVRNRSHLAEIVAEFENRKARQFVPYRAVEITPLSERRGDPRPYRCLLAPSFTPGDRVAASPPYSGALVWPVARRPAYSHGIRRPHHQSPLHPSPDRRP